MIMNLEQRRREVRKHTQIRRTYNLDLEESTMARTRIKISKIANDYILLLKKNEHFYHSYEIWSSSLDLFIKDLNVKFYFFYVFFNIISNL